ncbi:MAG: zinc ribbon domain-containing protein [Thermodesulfobacteriota bacterium]|nr:MAG: zinc ribbon domain-containing protein [Thermodesulfobacteriota bacterium]
MPIYEFKCQKCGHEFEFYFKNKEELKDLKCPSCKSSNIQRLMSVVNSIIDHSEGPNKPRVVEEHTCPSGTCTIGELPGYSR